MADYSSWLLQREADATSKPAALDHYDLAPHFTAALLWIQALLSEAGKVMGSRNRRTIWLRAAQAMASASFRFLTESRPATLTYPMALQFRVDISSTIQVFRQLNTNRVGFATSTFTVLDEASVLLALPPDRLQSLSESTAQLVSSTDFGQMQVSEDTGDSHAQAMLSAHGIHQLQPAVAMSLMRLRVLKP